MTDSKNTVLEFLMGLNLNFELLGDGTLKLIKSTDDKFRTYMIKMNVDNATDAIVDCSLYIGDRFIGKSKLSDLTVVARLMDRFIKLAKPENKIAIEKFKQLIDNSKKDVVI